MPSRAEKIQAMQETVNKYEAEGLIERNPPEGRGSALAGAVEAMNSTVDAVKSATTGRLKAWQKLQGKRKGRYINEMQKLKEGD